MVKKITKSEIIGLYLNDYSKRFYLRELASLLKKPHQTIKPYVENLVKDKILIKDIRKNILIVSGKAREEDFYKREVEIRKANWIGGKPPAKNKIYKARIRYRQPLQSCKINNVKKYKVIFSKPQRAVTSGQSLVIYSGQTMLGGGVIK